MLNNVITTYIGGNTLPYPDVCRCQLIIILHHPQVPLKNPHLKIQPDGKVTALLTFFLKAFRFSGWTKGSEGVAFSGRLSILVVSMTYWSVAGSLRLIGIDEKDIFNVTSCFSGVHT